MKQVIRHIDTLIIGQGLAGSILAWQLIQQGQDVVVLADEACPSASRVAAGIFNPLSGQRLLLQKHAELIIPTARRCYRQLEAQFGQTFFHAKKMLRVFKHEAERRMFEQRQHEADYAVYLGAEMDSAAAMNHLASLRAPHGLGEQQQTGYLDSNALLDCLRDYFIAQGCYIAGHVEYHDLNCHADAVTWRDLHARRIIFCQGFMDQDNPYFDFLPFQPAKGEILTLTSQAALPDCIINAGKWLLPLHDGRYKTGATYTHDLSDGHATEQGKAELTDALQQMFDIPLAIDLVEQQAGIRPNTLDKNPFIGFRKKQPALGIFNGFGSKGSMLIPYYAQAFVDHICNAAALPLEADIVRIERAKKIKQPRVALTARVHQHLLAYLQPEHICIDATAGNGHDSLFLLRHTSAQGQVFVFDVQPQAIENTRRRLADAGFDHRAELFCSGHEHMLDHIPVLLLGKVNVIMFNLGYLPQADKKLITRTATTLQALDASVQLLAIGGRISILAYPGHAGGDHETRAVQTWLMKLSADHFEVVMHESLSAKPNSPQWMEVIRLS